MQCPPTTTPAHSAITEMSAHPVSKSSLWKDYTIPRPLKRGPKWNRSRPIWPGIKSAGLRAVGRALKFFERFAAVRVWQFSKVKACRAHRGSGVSPFYPLIWQTSCSGEHSKGLRVSPCSRQWREVGSRTSRAGGNFRFGPRGDILERSLALEAKLSRRAEPTNLDRVTSLSAFHAPAGICRGLSQFLFNANELVVFRHAIGP